MSTADEIRICVPVSEKTLIGLTAAAKNAVNVADVIELRIDGLDSDQIESTGNQLHSLIRSISRPVILTFRPAEQGGYRTVSDNERLAFWQNYFHSAAAFFDVEFDLVKQLINQDAEEQPDWSRIICSHHDFTGVPNNLEELYEQMAFTPARILKLAVKANKIVDCLQVFKILDWARAADREIIAIGMGDAGSITRILGPSRGAYLTYGSSEAERRTAPGQLVASDLRAVYRINRIDKETLITGLIGSPVSHSVSPHMHNAAFESLDLNAVYLPLEVNDVHDFVARMVDSRSREFDWNLKGLSVTAPHKVAVMQSLDWIDKDALKIGAVNTVVLENEKLYGYNTDADGLVEPLIRRLGALAGLSAAVIGSGGAASAAVFALRRQQVDVTLYARNLENVRQIAERFNISYETAMPLSFAGKDLVINATPLGSFGDQIDQTVALADQLQGVRLVYDLVYNPIETRLLREARTAGCQVLGGLEMLVAQAALQFKLWTKMNAPYELMYTAGLSALREKFLTS